MSAPDLSARQEALAEWLREHLIGYVPTGDIHSRSELYEVHDLDACAADLAVLADAGVIGEAPGSDGAFGHRWRATEYVPMMVTVVVPVSSPDEDWDSVAETLRDIIDIPAAEIAYRPWEMRIRVAATGNGPLGGLQAAHEIVTVLYDALLADCGTPKDSQLMLLRSFLEGAFDVTVEVRGDMRRDRSAHACVITSHGPTRPRSSVEALTG